MYLTQVPYVSPLMFRLATQQNAATGSVAGGEKTAFAWWVGLWVGGWVGWLAPPAQRSRVWFASV